MLKGEFEPKDVFPDDPGNDIVLLGGIKLNEIVNLVKFAGPPPEGEFVPRLTTTVENGETVARYRWYLQKGSEDTETEYRGGLFDTGLFVPDLDAEFEIVSEVRRPLDGSPGSFLSTGRLTNFGIVLLPGAELVKLHFGELKFTARSGQKTDVVVALTPDPESNQAITFLGPLSLRQRIDAGGAAGRLLRSALSEH